MNNTGLVQVSLPLQAAYRYPGAGAGGAEKVRTRPVLFTLQTGCRPPAAGPLRACIFWCTGVETLTGVDINKIVTVVFREYLDIFPGISLSLFSLQEGDHQHWRYKDVILLQSRIIYYRTSPFWNFWYKLSSNV